METLLQHLNYQPNGLTPKEIREPELAIAYFFRNHPLHLTRETNMRTPLKNKNEFAHASFITFKKQLEKRCTTFY